MSGRHDLGSPHGGGPQGEPVEGSLTDGGSLPGTDREDRSFGAGRRSDAPAPAPEPEQAAPPEPAAGAPVEARPGQERRPDAEAGRMFQGLGEDPGVADDGGEAGPGSEHSGYGNTPPR